MGGHGAWHLATHFPDMALAVVSLAGWIKKEEYGDSNLFFRSALSDRSTTLTTRKNVQVKLSRLLGGRPAFDVAIPIQKLKWIRNNNTK